MIPFHKQETRWTCSAAAMRMALEACGIRKSEKQVVRLLKTNKIRGTWHENFPKVAEKYKLNYVVKRNSNIGDLKKFLKEKYFIIVNYYYPPQSVDHYSVIKSIDSKHIYFLDPWYGKNHKYAISEFRKLWHDTEKEKCWLIAIKK